MTMKHWNKYLPLYMLGGVFNYFEEHLLSRNSFLGLVLLYYFILFIGYGYGYSLFHVINHIQKKYT